MLPLMAAACCLPQNARLPGGTDNALSLARGAFARPRRVELNRAAASREPRYADGKSPSVPAIDAAGRVNLNGGPVRSILG